MQIGLFTRAFWGVFLLVFGLLALLKSYVDIQIPLFRLAVGVLLIWTGAVLLFGGGFAVDAGPGTVVMQSRTVEVSRSGEHSTVFGDATFRVAAPPVGTDYHLQFNSVFSSTEIRVPRDVAVEVQSSSVFGSVTTPDGRSSFFGEQTYKKKTARGVESESPESVIFIEVNAVFSSVKLVGE